MNNEQLVELFQRINKTSNCFDRELQLRKAKKEYKKSDFYKQTHYSIHKAFLLFNANALNTISAFLNSSMVQSLLRGNKTAFVVELEHLIDGFDYTKLDAIFKYLSDQFTNLISENGQLKIDLQQLIEGAIPNIN